MMPIRTEADEAQTRHELLREGSPDLVNRGWPTMPLLSEIELELRSKRFGQVSLTLSIGGILLVTLGWLAIWLDAFALTEVVLFGGLITSVTIEAFAVVFGLAARRTMMGKVSLALSLLTLALLLAFCGFIFAVLSSGMTGRMGQVIRQGTGNDTMRPVFRKNDGRHYFLDDDGEQV